MQVSNIGNTIGDVVVSTAGYGAVGYIGTMAFTNLNPMVGFVFGAAYKGVGYLIDPIFSRPNSTINSQLVGETLKISLAAGVALSSFGLAFSVKTTIALSVSTLVLPTVAFIAGACALVGTGIVIKNYIDQKNMERVLQSAWA